jgi:hypothetical protein
MRPGVLTISFTGQIWRTIPVNIFSFQMPLYHTFYIKQMQDLQKERFRPIRRSRVSEQVRELLEFAQETAEVWLMALD